jgi:hypothetical protein
MYERQLMRRTGREVGDTSIWSHHWLMPFDASQWAEYQARELRRKNLAYVRDFQTSGLSDEALNKLADFMRELAKDAP